MTFKLFTDEVDLIIKKSLERIGYGSQNYNLLEPPRTEYGDITCNVAFILSKKFAKSPYEIACQIVKGWSDYRHETEHKINYVKSVEVHNAGYINFTANFDSLGAMTLRTILENKAFGFDDIGKGKKVILEHTSVNPNKALHIGHLRNVILGDTLYRLLKQTNHDVIVTNYIDDSGLQIADIVVGFQYAKFPIDPSDKTVKFDRYCGDEIYVKVNNLYKVDSSLLKIRTEILRQLETDDNEVSSFASKITRKVLESQLKTCWRVKSRYDLLTFESHILHSNLWQQLFQILKTRGIIEYRSQGKNAGCWVYVTKDGSDEKVIVRSDGTATYIAKDICFAGLKMGLVKDPLKYSIFCSQWDNTDLWTTTIFDKNLDEGMFQKIHNPIGSSSIQKYFFPGDLAVTLIDERQKRLQNIIEEILDRIASHGSKYLGLSYGTVTLSAKTARQLNLQVDSKAESVNMSGRSGIAVNADFVLDLLYDRAKQAARERNPSLSGEELDKIAGDIAVSAARYNLLKYDVEKMVKFDLEDSISLEGDSGPYIQYTHARICSLVDKSQLNDKIGYEMNDIKQVSEALEMREEHDLFRQLSKFEISVSEAVRNYEPKILTVYLHKLATLFNIYYEKIPIAKERDLRLAQARILLSVAVRIVISSGLSVLGMSPLERM